MADTLAQRLWVGSFASDFKKNQPHPQAQLSTVFLSQHDVLGIGSAHSVRSCSDTSAASSELAVPEYQLPRAQIETGTDQRSQAQKERSRRIQKQFRARAKEREQALEDKTQTLKLQLDHLEREKGDMEMHVQMLARTVSSNQAHQNSKAQSPPYIPADTFEYASPFEGNADLVLKSVFDRPLQLTSAQVQGMHQEHHWQLHKAMVTKAQKLLSQCSETLTDGQVVSAAGRELEALVNERQGITFYLSGRHPLTFQKMLCNLHEGQPSDAYFWHKRDLKLTQEQQRYLGSEMRKYLGSMQRLLKERQRLQSMLAALEVGPVTSQRSASQQQLAWAQLTQALRDNCDSEFMHCASLCTAITYSPLRKNEQGLTVFQRAQLYVSSYPFQPELFNVLVILEGGIPNLVRLADEGGAPGYFLPDPSVEPYVSLQEKLHGMLYMPHLSMAAVC